MKIAIVSQAADTHSGSRAPIELAKHFVKLGHEVIFFAHGRASKKNAIDELRSAKVKAVQIDYPRIKFIDQFLAAFILAKRLRRLKPNFISAHTTLPFMLSSKLSGILIFSTYHGTQQDVWLDKIFPRIPNTLDRVINVCLNLLIKTIMRTQLALSNRVITLSKYCSQELEAFYGKKAPFIYWGSASPHLLNIRQESRKSNSVNLLSVSRIVPYKGFHLLINILKDLNRKYSNLKLTIIGSHPDKEYLSYLKKIKPENVEIIINASDQILSKHYQKADIYITADKFLFFGEPVMEAASFGKPTIAFDFASAKELIQNNNIGYVVKSQKEFEKALSTLIRSPQKRAILGKNAQKFARNLTWEKCARSYLQLFEKWLNK